MLVVWLKKTTSNSKFSEVEGKVPSITGLLLIWNKLLLKIKNPMLAV